MPGILGQVDQLIRILLQVMEEFMIVIDIANILVVGIAHSLVGRNAMPHREVFVEGITPPVR